MIDEVDRILVSEDHVTPSGGLLASVMEAVRASCVEHVPIPFPWRRFTVGLVGGLACTFLTMMLLAPEFVLHWLPGVRTWLPMPSWLCVPEIVWAALVLAGSLLIVRLSVALTQDHIAGRRPHLQDFQSRC
jgi:hypothetical protein